MPSLALIVWTGVVATALSTLAPGVVGGLVDDYALTAAQAGQIVAASLVGMVIGPACVVAIGLSGRIRPVLAGACVAMALGHAASASTTSFGALLAMQALAGVGGGLGLAGVTVLAAATSRPTATFGWIIAGQMLFGALGFVGLPWLRSLHDPGIALAFAVLAALAAVSLYWLRRLPQSVGGAADAVPGLRWSWPAGLVCFSLLAHYVANTAVWAYLERIGVDAGFSNGAVGVALGLSMIAGIAGGALAGIAGRHATTIGWISIGILVIAGATALLFDLDRYSTYLSGSALSLAAIGFTVPFYYSWLADFDATGRWVLLGNLAVGLGLSAGPAIGSQLIGDGRFDHLLTVALALFAAALAIAIAASVMTAAQGVPRPVEQSRPA